MAISPIGPDSLLHSVVKLGTIGNNRPVRAITACLERQDLGSAPVDIKRQR